MAEGRISLWMLVSLGCLIGIAVGQEGLNYADQSTWGGICLAGQHQSPIDLPSKAEMIPSEVLSIQRNAYALINEQALSFSHGYKYMLSTRGTNSALFVAYKGIEYQYDLNEIHFHFKSEHTIQSGYADIEMHMVHKKNAAFASQLGADPDEVHQYLVVAVMFKASNVGDNLFISSLKLDTRSPMINVDLRPFVNEEKPFYYYTGSFTTPPCNEIVHWIVMEQAEPISLRQKELIVGWISERYPNGNNRATYPLNGRSVYYINPSKQLSNKAETVPNMEGASLNFTVSAGISFAFILVTLSIIGGFLKM